MVASFLCNLSGLSEARPATKAEIDAMSLQCKLSWLRYSSVPPETLGFNFETMSSDQARGMLKQLEVETDHRESFTNWWREEMNCPGKWMWDYKVVFQPGEDLQQKRTKVRSFIQRLGGLYAGECLLEEVDNVTLGIRSTGRTLGLIINPVGIKGWLWPTEGVEIKEISPTNVTRQFVLQAAQAEFKQPKIWDQVVKQLRLEDPIINANPELKALLREAKEVGKQAEEA